MNKRIRKKIIKQIKSNVALQSILITYPHYIRDCSDIELINIFRPALKYKKISHSIPNTTLIFRFIDLDTKHPTRFALEFGKVINKHTY